MNETTILGRGRAPGKVILFGEHAVVYGRPALAVPVTQVWAEATVEAAAPGAGITIHAADLGEEIALRAASADHPLAAAVRLALAAVHGAGERRSRGAGEQGSAGAEEGEVSNLQPPTSEPDWRITVRSTIPVASGLGSGAAVTAAVVRAIINAANRRISESASGESAARTTHHREASLRDAPRTIAKHPFGTHHAIRNTQYAIPATTLSALIYEVERLHHGTPSGIDNTVIAYGQPVYFVRGRPPQPFAIGRPFTLVIADTGIRSPTRIAVGDVRAIGQRESARFEALFDRIGAIVEAARAAIADGQPEQLGSLMDANHALLQEIGVSCPELDALVSAARAAGALGAKLSGAGRGGNMIALVTEKTAAQVAEALSVAGAAQVIVTSVGA